MLTIQSDKASKLKDAKLNRLDSLCLPNTIKKIVQITALSVMSSAVYAQNIVIGALVSGQVSQVYVSEGETVKAGQKLVNLDAQRYQAKLSMLKAQVALQEARFADAKIDLDMELDLFDRTVTSRRTLDAAKLSFKVVESELATAKAALDAHRAWQKYVYIKAPVDGKVVKIHAPKGATVFKENQPILEMEVSE